MQEGRLHIAMNQYMYKPLPKESSFRLLRIVDTDSGEALHAHMEEATLEEMPVYVALSDIWGTDVPQTELVVNDQSMQIRKNLADAI